MEIDRRHMRMETITEDGVKHIEPYPLCAPIAEHGEPTAIENYGVGINLYFKFLVKSSLRF